MSTESEKLVIGWSVDEDIEIYDKTTGDSLATVIFYKKWAKLPRAQKIRLMRALINEAPTAGDDK